MKPVLVRSAHELGGVPAALLHTTRPSPRELQARSRKPHVTGDRRGTSNGWPHRASSCRASAWSSCSIRARRSWNSPRSRPTWPMAGNPRRELHHRHRHRLGPRGHDPCRRSDGEGRRLVSADGQEDRARAGYRHRESPARRAPVRFRRRAAAAAVRSSFRTAIWPGASSATRACSARWASSSWRWSSATARQAAPTFPALSDYNVIVRGTGAVFLGGPPLVKAATGEVVSADELGGCDLHTRTSGTCDYPAASETEAIAHRPRDRRTLGARAEVAHARAGRPSRRYWIRMSSTA